MTLCADVERDHQVFERNRATPAMLAHDAEHGWRDAGEWAIREEMERRLAKRGWLTPSHKDV